jgi:hypothetical protein
MMAFRRLAGEGSKYSIRDTLLKAYGQAEKTKTRHCIPISTQMFEIHHT